MILYLILYVPEKPPTHLSLEDNTQTHASRRPQLQPTLYRINRRGFIREGYYADLVLVDNTASYVVKTADIKSKCGWSPFEGVHLHNRVHTTFVNGEKVYENGEIIENVRGQRLTFSI